MQALTPSWPGSRALPWSSSMSRPSLGEPHTQTKKQSVTIYIYDVLLIPYSNQEGLGDVQHAHFYAKLNICFKDMHTAYFFNINKIYTVFTQQQDTNSLQVPIDCKLEDNGTSRDKKQGVKMSWSKGIEIIQSLFFWHCGFMLEINIKRYLKITHIVSSAV